ncbi:TauD/TfdA family dioxygenase [Nannocystis pusilla]|uniref:TauD/TfdA family dioxygenase n=1 Tax=Nannocystis pusilla TaxID=889268 RepID=A0A9X3IVS4_9BACT|nr:TauD/TfdA family dioxygenase [Nannocystis pusilla]
MRLSEIRGPGGGAVPVVEPDGDARVDALRAWLDAEKTWLSGQLRSHGAVLLRGFGVRVPVDLEHVARAIEPGLKNEYLGTSPRDALSEYVFSASELPPYYPIPQHCEMSFLRDPPRRLFFACLVAPQGGGGETRCATFAASSPTSIPTCATASSAAGSASSATTTAPTAADASTCGSSSAGTRCS